MTTAPQPRRIGAADSKTRAQLLDAAEQLLLDEGYAAVTSRRVGAKAGLKPQLVHYYFRTMDDLFLEVFRRRADENLAHFERTVAADTSLRTLWRLNADPRGAAFMTEFVALGQPPQVHPDRDRPLRRAFPRRPARGADGCPPGGRDRAGSVPPIAALLLMTGLSQVLSLERVLGVTAGHDATGAFVQSVIDRLEP